MNTQKLDSKILSEHGTEFLTMPPGAIVTAALNDISIFRKSKPKSRPRLAFPRYHVSNATTAEDLLSSVMKDGSCLVQTGRAMLLLHFDDLLEARDLARERGV